MYQCARCPEQSSTSGRSSRPSLLDCTCYTGRGRGRGRASGSGRGKVSPGGAGAGLRGRGRGRVRGRVRVRVGAWMSQCREQSQVSRFTPGSALL